MPARRDTSGLSSGGASTADAGQADGPAVADDGRSDACSPTAVPLPDAGPIAPLDPRWILLGRASVDGPAVRLTDGGQHQSGAIWWSAPVTFGDFDVTAAIRIQTPDLQNIADGLTFAWVRGDIPELDGPGGGLGVEKIAGYAVALDLFVNDNQPFVANAPYVAVFDTTKSYANRTLVARTVPFSVTDGAEHVIGITLRSGAISVSIDQQQLVDRFAIPDYAPFTGHFGFTATTGAGVAIQTLLRAGVAPSCP